MVSGGVSLWDEPPKDVSRVLNTTETTGLMGLLDVPEEGFRRPPAPLI